MVLRQGWSLCFLILRNSTYYTEGPKKTHHNSDVQVLLVWSQFICIRFFLILSLAPFFMISFLEQKQPQGCLSPSRENTYKYMSSCVCAFKWVLTQKFFKTSLIDSCKICAPFHAGTGTAKTTAAQYRLPSFPWAAERLAYLKAWPLFQLY